MNYTNTTVWLLIGIIGLFTFGLRISFILGMDYFREPDWLKRLLRFVPAAVLSGLVAGGLWLRQGQLSWDWQDPRYPAALLAGWVAWRTKNILWTILSGMGALWLGQWLFGLYH